MRYLIIILLLLAAIPAKSYAWFDKPTVEDYILQTGFITVTSIDWMQTRFIATNENYDENNLILGYNPSLKKVNLYFISSIILHTSISFILPKKYYLRSAWQSIWIGIETKCTVQNYDIGIKFKF